MYCLPKFLIPFCIVSVLAASASPGNVVLTFGGAETHVALCAEDGKELQTARGARSRWIQAVRWDLSAYVGKALFIRVVDRSTGGCGHVTADDFRFDGGQSQ
ncbi:MAG: hypothetical protein ACI8W8_005046 [Rhodothermales bacterium]|jgi:hypothetical protein